MVMTAVIFNSKRQISPVEMSYEGFLVIHKFKGDISAYEKWRRKKWGF
jgi:hypothetical protein